MFHRGKPSYCQRYEREEVNYMLMGKEGKCIVLKPQEKILTKDVYCQIEGHVGRQQSGGCSVLTLLVILNVVSILVAVLWASGSSVRSMYIPYSPKIFL